MAKSVFFGNFQKKNYYSFMEFEKSKFSKVKILEIFHIIFYFSTVLILGFFIINFFFDFEFSQFIFTLFTTFFCTIFLLKNQNFGHF